MSMMTIRTRPIPDNLSTYRSDSTAHDRRDFEGWDVVQERVSRRTGTRVVVWHTGSGHYAWCETHGRYKGIYEGITMAREYARYPDAFCRECAALVERGARHSEPIVKADDKPKATPTGLDRRYGVELEVKCQVGRDDLQERIEKASGLDGWKVKWDGSVDSHYAQDGTRYEGMEVVSPILQGLDGLAQIHKVCQIIEEAGTMTDDQCGLHVHLDMNEEKVENVKGFVKSWIANQDLIDWLTDRDRVDTYYAAHFNSYDIRALDNADSADDFYDCERYRTVNPSAYAEHGTIEVRQHQGTFSYVQIAAWVKFCQSVMDAVAQANHAFGTHPSIKALLASIKTDQESASTLLGFAAIQGADTKVLVGA